MARARNKFSDFEGVKLIVEDSLENVGGQLIALLRTLQQFNLKQTKDVNAKLTSQNNDYFSEQVK